MHNTVLVAVLRTKPLEKHYTGGDTEDGIFEIQVHVERAQAMPGKFDRKTLFQIVAFHLAHGIKETGVPKEFWEVHYELNARNWFALPAIIPFG